MQIILKQDDDILEWSKERITISDSLLLTKIKEVFQYIITYFEENEAGFN